MEIQIVVSSRTSRSVLTVSSEVKIVTYSQLVDDSLKFVLSVIEGNDQQKLVDISVTIAMTEEDVVPDISEVLNSIIIPE